MSVDKFGRHQDYMHRNPPGEGFPLTPGGHYDMRNLLIRNLAEPKAGKDAVTLHYLRKNSLITLPNGNYGCEGKLITNVGSPIHVDDVATKGYLQKVCLTKLQEIDEFSASNLKITNLADCIKESDAVNLKTLQREMLQMTQVFEEQLVRLGAALFHYIHRQSGPPPSTNINNRNYLDWNQIHGKVYHPPAMYSRIV